MELARQQAKDLGIEELICFAGNKGNVYDYYQAMDYFVYPSRYEGLRARWWRHRPPGSDV